MLTNPGKIVDQCLQRAIEKDLPAVEEELRRPREDELEVFLFPQCWGSTALGLGGVGGQAVTTAYTCVVAYEQTAAAVYFGGALAYVIPQTSMEFWLDLYKMHMEPRSKVAKYFRRIDD